MIKYADSQEFTLSKKLRYQKNGDVLETDKLDMFAPSRDNFSQVLKLKQGYHKAQSQVAARYLPLLKNIDEFKDKFDKQDKEEDIATLSTQVLEALYTSDIDIEDYFNCFKLLCTKGAIKTLDGVILTNEMLSNISINDLERLLGEYLGFFIVASTTKKT